MDAESLYYENIKLKKQLKAYESFEGEVEYANGKVHNDRIESALEDLQDELSKIEDGGW